MPGLGVKVGVGGIHSGRHLARIRGHRRHREGLSTTAGEDVNGVWVDAAGKICLTTIGPFAVSGVSSDASDIFACTPGSLGCTTACTLAMYWDGSANGFAGEVTDSVCIIP